MMFVMSGQMCSSKCVLIVYRGLCQARLRQFSSRATNTVDGMVSLTFDSTS